MRRAAVLAAAAVTLAVLGPATSAGAHAFLTDSNPRDGAVLNSAPGVLRLEFSESVVIAATRIELVDSTGRKYTPSRLRIVHLGGGDSTEEPAQVVADLPALPQSAYRVSWQTLSSDDLHRTSGVLVFGVNAPVRAAGFTEPKPRAEEAALRWLLFLCLAGALGGLLAVRLYRRAGAERTAPVAACRRIAIAGAAAGLLVALALLVEQVASSRASVGRLLLSAYGLRWGLREAGLALLLLAAAWVLGPYRRMRTGALVTAGAAAVGIGSALLGHAGAASAGPTRRLADAAHLTAAATWSGLLVVALLVLLPRLRSGGEPAANARAVLRGFGLPAAACVSVLAVTGVYLASGAVGSVDAALRTVYGRVLIGKLIVVCAAGVLGLVNTRALHARRPHPDPRRTVRTEALLAVAVLALAAVLASGQPALEPQFVAAPHLATVPLVDATVGDLQQSLAVRPNRPGRNVVLVDVHDTRRPAPAPVRGVLVSVDGPDGRPAAAVAAERLTDDRWSAALPLDSSGRTRIRVTVQRGGLPALSHDYRWTVGGAPSRTRAALVSTAPVAGPLRSAAALLAVLLGLAWGAVAWRRLGGPATAARRDGPPVRGEPVDVPTAVAAGDLERVG